MSVWHRRFLTMTEGIRSWSKDPSTQVGALIVPPSRRQFSGGYNGLPMGITDNDRLLNRDWKIKSVVHAEANALLLCPFPTEGCSMYVVGCFPCAHGCAAMIIQKGIYEVVVWEDEIALSRWDCKHTFELFDEAAIQVVRVPR